MSVGASEEDRLLVARLLSGEEAAFEELFGDYLPPLYRFALSRVGRDEDAAEEVAQATLCRVIEKLETYRGEAALLTWMCTFCRHEVSQWFRKNRREHREADFSEDAPELRAALESLATTGDEPVDDLRRREVTRLVRAILDRLPPRYGRALEWKYLDELPVAEIAGRLGLGLRAAESLLARARRSFREGFTAASAELCQADASGTRR